MIRTLRTAFLQHWPEYLIEAALLAAFMLSAIGCTVLLEHPGATLRAAIPSPLARRLVMGLAMGLTAMALIYSPAGARSGAHFNPAVTLTFARLGKIDAADACFYVLFQFAGGVVGAGVAALVLAELAADPAVRFAATTPGTAGIGAALVAEIAISCALMMVVLATASTPASARFTGAAVGALLVVYVTLEAPLSGMSMNPARTLGSAAGAGLFDALWVYFVAPLAGMLLAAELHRGRVPVRCAKLRHARPCIFRCDHQA